MTNNGETGIVKNAANLGRLITILQGLGVRYKPASPRIAISNLSAKKTLIDQLIDQHKTTHRKMRDKKAGRRALFAPTNGISTQLLYTFRSLSLSEEDIDAAEDVQRKIQGYRAEDIDDEPETEATQGNGQGDGGKKHISVSQRSFDNLIAHWEEWRELMAVTEEYATNEEHLTLAAITAMIANMKLANTEAEDAKYAEIDIRSQRDNVMFLANDSILNLVAEVKQYIRIILKPHEPQYKEIMSLVFKSM